MLCAVLLMLALAVPQPTVAAVLAGHAGSEHILPAQPQDPVAAALESYQNVSTYRVTLRSGHGKAEEIIKYLYKKPGFIRMEFVKPHPGALLAYNPLTKIVRLRPFGFAKALALSLSPDNRLVKSARGHSVDASDIGALLAGVQALQAQGDTALLGEEMLGGQKTVRVEVTGKPGVVLDGVHRYQLWLDPATWLPRKVLAYGPTDTVVDEAIMDDLEVNIPLDEGIFTF